jgi:hypothetical protein
MTTQSNRKVSTKAQLNQVANRRVLCWACHNPILATDLGGVMHVEGKEAWFHDFLPCLLEFHDQVKNAKSSKEGL